jgi:uncharacterized membrane protein
MNKTVTSSFALSVAALFMAGCSKQAPVDDVSSADTDPKVKCMGVNGCKGQADCGGSGGHSCAGQNDCKGKGWISIPKSECQSRGGQVL